MKFNRRLSFPCSLVLCGATLLLSHNLSTERAPAAEPDPGPPRAEISNAVIHAKLLLPDPVRGYYRGPRFDWSGVMPSLTFSGHEYFGKWFDHYNPTHHDAIMGPVEEFSTDGAALGYADAKPGETFVKIGVGVLRKPDERSYSLSRAYEILDTGKWAVRSGPDWIEFVHRLTDGTGYGYEYRKTIRLVENSPVMVLDHTLKNTGRKTIETSHYNHNFFMIDGLPIGPDTVVKFPFNIEATGNLRGLAEVRGGEFVYLRELEKGQTVATHLKGFGSNAADYHITIENRKARAGARITGDRPLSELYFWSIRTTVCPEPYVQMRIEPGAEFSWKIRYEFYTLPMAQAN